MAWYTPSGAPANQSSLTSASMRAEFALIQTNISNKLPTYTGNGSKAIFVNSGGTALEAVTAATARTNLGLVIGTNVQAWGADLDALDALSSTGIAVRTASNTWAQRTITAPAAGISIADGNGVSGNPTLSLANDLLALEGLSSTGIAVRTTTDTWAQRTITGTSAEITVTNGNGVSGNPTLSLPTALTFTGKTVTGGTFSSPVINTGTVGTSLNPTSDDGAALGSASASWSDLFLASGALLNFANGNAVVTHSSGILTVSTGDLRVTTAGTNSASAVTVGGTQTLTSKTLTSPTINGGALSGTFSGAHTKSGILTLTASGSASNSALKLVSTEPSIGWNNTNAAADNKQWDMEIASLTLVGRVINDAGSVAANWITVTRSGATITSVNFPNGALQAGGVAVPTISSTSTLTNKTIALGSNTVSGTMAQFDTACTDGNFVYQSQALGTPASGTLTNCTGLPQAGTVGLTTADSPQFTGINLGHASDTTFTRPAAGRAQIEGREIVTAAADATALTSTIAELNILDGVTSTAAELNILDGVTATAAELNKTDDSAAAIASYVSGMRTYLHADGAPAGAFDFVANVTEAAYESVGPTGSGATNIWTAMDAMPANATIAIIGIATVLQPDGVDRTANMFVSARQTGSSASGIGSRARVHAHYILTDDYTAGTPEAYSIVQVPIDSSLSFDIYWTATNDASRQGEIVLKGFIV